MRNIKKNWSEITIIKKISLIIAIVLSVAVIVLSVMGVFDILPIESTNCIVMPMAGIITLINGISTYKSNKKLGVIILSCSAVIFICCIAIFAIRLFK